MASYTSGTSEEEERPKPPRQGGLRTVPFILVTEACDRFAGTGFFSNMISYLTQKLHLPLVQASNTLTTFNGTSNFTPIIGGLIADSFAGRFWTITASSIVFLSGMLCLTISASSSVFQPPSCSGPSETCERASNGQLWMLYGSLMLTSIGSGGIRPCVMAFGADQFDLRGGNQKWNFFNVYYFCMSAALLLALTVVIYVQDNVSWGLGLAIPTIAMGASIVIFVMGYPFYVQKKLGGSPLTRLAQVVVAAARKRHAPVPQDPSLLHEDWDLDADISTSGRLLHTDSLKFFDRAAIMMPGEAGHGKPNLWRLSTVHRVEELKSLLRMMPIWFVGVIAVMATSHNHSFVVMQARSMDRHLTASFQIPAASMYVFSVLTTLLVLALYDSVLVPVTRRFTGHPSGISYFQRMGIGFTIAILVSLTMSLVETKRKAVAAAHGLLDQPNATVPITIFWLVPQYVIHGLAEAFYSVGHLEFLYDQSPESMRSTAVALSWLASAMGNYLGTLLVIAVRNGTRGRGEWLQDNINRGRLDCYYGLVCGLQVVKLLCYLVCAKLYTSKPLETAKPETSSCNGGGIREMEVVRTQ